MDFMTEGMVTYKRQILQRIKNPPLPPGNILKDEEVQKWLAKNLFNENFAEEVGPTYLKTQLDRICVAIEKAIIDPQEEEVSTELYQLRSKLPTLAAREQEQLSQQPKRCLVRYHPPTDFSAKEQYISILEKPLVIGSGSDTGNRTWEASLRLMHFLYSKPELIQGRKVLELGAGSGLLSIFCAAILDAELVIATDASPQILAALEANVELNNASWSPARRRPITQQLNFADDLSSIFEDDLDNGAGLQVIPDIILGADLIYDVDLARGLGKNLQAIAGKTTNPLDLIVAATQRNVDTFSIFQKEFTAGRYVDFSVPEFHHQKGLYHTLATEIRIYGVLNRR